MLDQLKGNCRSARDTSEYGSGEPSPIANLAHHRHNYTASVADDSDPDDYDKYVCFHPFLRQE